MTRLAVLSDIHGNLPALEAVFADLEPFAVDGIVVAGDVVNGGPFPAQVMDRVLGAGCAVIRGNNELYLTDIGTPRAPANWANYSVPPWTRRQLGNRRLNAIGAWPDTLSLRFPDAAAVRVVHGSPRSAFDSMFPISTDADLEEMLAGVEETTVIAGHTHLPMERRVGRWHVLNPGSVGVPLDGLFGAGYLLLEGGPAGWKATFRRVPFDYDALYREFEQVRYADECGPVGHLIIEEARTARLQILPFLRWWREVHPDQPHSVALLELFSKIDKWQYMPPAYHVNRVASA
jgi:predicted phosphodiesterase